MTTENLLGHLDRPNLFIAVAAGVLLLFLASKKRRFTPTYLISAIFGGAGFALSGWVGLLTFLLALCYRIFQNLRAPWQAIITFGTGVTVFCLSALGLQRFVNENSNSNAENQTGIWATLTRTVNSVATNTTVLWVLLILSIVVVLFSAWTMRQQQKYPYRGLGRNVDTDMMYRGLENPNLVTLPEETRDPQRTFTSKMRKEKLDEQGGLCIYQKQISVHPKWEPYRSGIQWEADHIIPHAAGGATNYANLQVLCADCNSAKSDSYGQRALSKIEKRWKTKD